MHTKTTHTPSIHLNGSSRQTLLDRAKDAHDALERAYDALRAMSPNGRDYYPQGDAAINAAIKEHSELIKAIKAVYDDVEAYVERVDDAPGYDRRP